MQHITGNKSENEWRSLTKLYHKMEITQYKHVTVYIFFGLVSVYVSNLLKCRVVCVQDKVANTWCSLNVLIKIRGLLSSDSQLYLR